MKLLLEAIALILVLCFCIGLDFVFSGDPSIFDVFQAEVTSHYSQSICEKQPKDLQLFRLCAMLYLI